MDTGSVTSLASATVTAYDTLTIRSAALVCRQRLVVCAKTPVLTEKHWAQNRLADFNLWDAGVGASVYDPNSLDLRLGHDRSARKLVIGTLSALSAWLQKCIEIAKASSTETGTLDDVSDSDGLSSQASDSYEREDTAELPISLGEAKDSIADLLDVLIDLGMVIRQAGASSRFRKADRTFELRMRRPDEAYSILAEHLRFVLSLSAIPRQTTTPGHDSPPTRHSYSERVVPHHWTVANTLQFEQQVLLDTNMKRFNRFVFAMERGEKLDFRREQENASTNLHAPNKFTQRQTGQPFKTQGSILETQSEIVESKKTDRSPGSVTNTNQVSEFPPGQELEPTAMRIRMGAQPTAIARQSDYPAAPKLKNDTKAVSCPYCLLTLSTNSIAEGQWRSAVSKMSVEKHTKEL